MSNPGNFNYQGPKAGGCGKAVGIGCGSIFAIGILVQLASLRPELLWVVLVVVVIAIVLIVRNRRAKEAAEASVNKDELAQRQQSQTQMNQPQQSSASQYAELPAYNGVPPISYGGAPAAPSDPSNLGATYLNPLCHHRFTEEQVSQNEALACSCGNYFETADIKKYNKLFVERIAVNDKIKLLQEQMRRKDAESHAQAAASASASAAPAKSTRKATAVTASAEWKPSTTVAAPAAPAVAAKPRPEKPKVSFSLQQWLIIGAAILVMIAGSSFVAQGVAAGWPEGLFLAVTSGVGLATGFGAFFMRRTSIVVSTFLAAFSSAMQLTSLWTIGALISKPFAWKFDWKTQPGWWWATELFIVAVAALFLARASRLSGWKAISLLSLAASAVTLEVGPVRDLLSVHPDWTLINLSIVVVTAVATLYGSKLLRAIPRSAITDEKYAEYFEDLAERQDRAYFTATRFATLLQIIAGVGATISGVNGGGILSEAPNLIPIFILVAVAAGVSLTAKHWSGQLSDAGEPIERIVSIANGTIYIALSAAAIRLATMIPVSWVSALVALVAILAIVWVSPLAKAFKPSLNVMTVVLWVTAALWLIWKLPELAQVDLQTAQQATGWFLVGLAVVATLADVRLATTRNTWPAILVNAAGLVTLTAGSILGQQPSAGHTLTVLAIAIAANLPLALRWLLQGRKLELDQRIGAWISFGATAVLVISQSTFSQLTDAHLTDILLFAVAFMVYALVVQLLALRGPLAGKADSVLTAHHYLGQAVVAIIGLQLRYSPTVSVSALTLTGLLAGLIALNYGFGAFSRQALHLQLGFALILAAFFLNMWGVQASSLVTVYSVQLAFVAAVTAGHLWALNRRTESTDAAKTGTAFIGVALSLLVGVGAQWNTWANASNAATFGTLAVVAAFALGSLGLTRVKRASGDGSSSVGQTLRVLSLTYAAFGLATIAIYLPESRTIDYRWYAIATVLLFSLVARLNASALDRRAMAGLFVASNLVVAVLAATLTAELLKTSPSPEPYTVWLSVGLVASVLLFKDAFGGTSSALLIDTPILATATVSLAYGVLALDAATDVGADYRRIIASLVIAGFSMLRLRSKGTQGWLVAAYAAGAALGASVGFTISHRLVPDFNGPEIYTLLIAISVSVVTLIAGDAADKVRRWLLFEAPAIFVSVVSLAYGVLQPTGGIESDLRRILGAGLIAAIALIRLRSTAAKGVIALAYVATTATALAIAATIQNRAAHGFHGPEIYSLLAALAVLGVHRLALKKLELKSSLFSWGLPIGIALLPSTFFTYTSWGTSFSNLGADQITREVIVLVVSATLLTFGLRQGNLANASMGIAGLTLLVVPAVASQSSGEWQVQNTAMAAGFMLAGILGIARLAGKAKGNSMLFFGLPISLALAPALYLSLAALGHQSVEPADWWRFGILISASMVMLVLGTMREVAGLFYPGLVGVILTALPYGFKQAAATSWFLWVLLLALAGVMVWLAMRLEKMRKEGRTSSQWLRELK